MNAMKADWSGLKGVAFVILAIQNFKVLSVLRWITVQHEQLNWLTLLSIENVYNLLLVVSAKLDFRFYLPLFSGLLLIAGHFICNQLLCTIDL